MYSRSAVIFLIGNIVPFIAVPTLFTQCQFEKAAPRKTIVHVAVGPEGHGTLIIHHPQEGGAFAIVLKTDEDVAALMRRMPSGACLRTLQTIYPKTPPQLLAALEKHHPELLSLRLVSERVTDADLKHLAGLKRLRHLDLGTPRVTAEGLAVLSSLPELILIDCLDGKTPVTDDGLKALGQCSELRALCLSRTCITDAGLSQMRGLNKLGSLELSDTPVRRLTELPELPHLTHLVLSGTKVGDEDVRFLLRCPRLGGIYLDRTKVTGITLRALARLRHLETLSLATAPVTDAGLASIAENSGLRYLNIRRSRVTDAGIASVAKLKRLHSLKLDETGVTDACLSSLTEVPILSLSGTRVTKDRSLEFSRQHPHLYLVINEGNFVAGKRALSPGEADEKAGRDRAP